MVVLSVQVPEPEPEQEFEDQSNNRLGNPDVRGMVD